MLSKKESKIKSNVHNTGLKLVNLDKPANEGNTVINKKIDLKTDTHLKTRKPKWLKVKLPTGEKYKNVRKITSTFKLHTICESGNCPNMGECWGEGTATFMILGIICTRSCGFCKVMTGRPLAVDPLEPVKVAQSIKLMKVKHAVITSVDRDELKDGGSSIWAHTIRAIRKINPNTTMETLIPDFKGKKDDINRIINEAPEVVSHNTVSYTHLTLPTN